MYTVDVAVDARLLGRFRLLSIDAAIDVAEPVDPRLQPRPPERRSELPASAPFLAGRPRPATGHRTNGTSAHRRVDAEALLGDAERSLGATPVPPRA